MSLGFTLPNLGPLSQVSFGFQDVATVMHLATGIYGWANSGNRALSLERTLASSGISLAAISNFNRDVYLASRQKNGNTWGVARDISNTLSRIRLPRASTATEGYPGLLSLRALITGLLCFVDQEQIPFILQCIPPARIFHFEQEGKKFAIQGPFLAALIHYIRSVAAEEGADDYRTSLLSGIDTQIQRVTCAELGDLRATQDTELGYIIGLLNWLLTPPSQPKAYIYRTRSLRVWCLALALSEMGFELEADRMAITEPTDQSNPSPENDQYCTQDMVALVLAPGWSTDQGRKLSAMEDDLMEKPIVTPPRIISVRTFPAIAYVDEAISDPSLRQMVDAKELEEAFIGTYVFVRHKLSCNEKIRHAAKITSCIPIDARKYGVLLHGPRTAQATEDIYKEFRVQLYSGHHVGSPKDQVIEPMSIPIIDHYLSQQEGQKTRFLANYLRLAIIMATVSLFVHCPDEAMDDTRLDMQFLYTTPSRGGEPSKNGQTKWYQATIDFLNRLQNSVPFPREVRYIKQVINSPTSWKSLVLKVILDIDQSESSIKDTDDMEGYWGAQRQGLVLQSDFVLNPSAEASSAYIFHATHGHLLDIPAEGDRILEGQTSTPTLRHFSNTPLPDKASLMKVLLAPPPRYIGSLHVSLEPCWESDSNRCRFVLRAGGLPKVQLGMSSLFRSSYTSTETDQVIRIRCSSSPNTCPGPKSIEQLMFNHPKAQNWFELPLQQMIEQSKLGVPTLEKDSGVTRNAAKKSKLHNWFVNTHGNEVLLTLALQCPFPIYESGRCRIITDCLGAALLTRHTPCDRSTMVILHNEKHNRLTEPPKPGYSARDDLLRTAAYLISDCLQMTDLQTCVGDPSLMLQASRLIWQPTEAQTDDEYALAAVTRLRLYKEHKGITEAGILETLQAIHLDEIIDPSATYKINFAAVRDTTEDLIAEWQRNHLSESEFARMLQSLEQVDEEIERLDDPALEGLVRNTKPPVRFPGSTTGLSMGDVRNATAAGDEGVETLSDESTSPVLRTTETGENSEIPHIEPLITTVRTLEPRECMEMIPISPRTMALGSEQDDERATRGTMVIRASDRRSAGSSIGPRLW